MKKIPAVAYYLAIAALIGGYIFFFERGPMKTDAEKDKDKKVKVFADYVADDIDQIKLENLSTTITAVKVPVVLQKNDKDNWEVKSPHEFKGDDATIHTMLSSVADLAPDTTIENATNLGDFGLNTLTARCTFTSKTGKTFIILVGDKSVTNSNYYVKTPDKNNVYMVQAFVVDNMTKGVNEYRDKSFFKTDAVLAQQVEVDYGGKKTVFQKGSEGSWKMTEPMQVKADDQKVKDLLSSIGNLRIVGFPDDHPVNLAIYGLSQPRAAVKVWSSNSKEPDVILIGREKLKANQDFVKSGNLPFVYLINNYFSKSLDIKPLDYRDKSMMKFDGGAVKSITVSHRGKNYQYKKDDKGMWSCDGRPKAQEEGNYLANSLSGTVISDFASKRDATGLKTPTYLIEVQLTTGEQRTYRFGNIRKNDVYLASDKSKDVYLVPSNMLSQLDTYYSEIMTPVPMASPAAK